MNTKHHELLENVFSNKDIESFYNTLIKYEFEDETNHVDDSLPGKLHKFTEDDAIYKSILDKTENIFPQTKDIKPYAAYVNLLQPREETFYHRDDTLDSPHNSTTVLYYITPDFDLNEGGETLFYNEHGSVLMGLTPKSGRVTIFDGSILYKDTGFKSKPRITVVLKYYLDKE